MITELPFILSYREQQQLFLFDWNYISDILFAPGGASIVAGRFLVQFFYSPALAVIITLLCLASIAWLHRRQFPLILAPLLFLLASLPDHHLHFDVVPALMFSSGALAIWEKCKIEKKRLCGAILTIVVFMLAGSAAAVFTLSALASSVFYGEKVPGQLKHPAFAAIRMNSLCFILGFVAWKLNFIPELGHAFSPVFFYDVSAAMPGFHLLFWFGCPVCILLAGLCGRFLKQRPAILASCLMVTVVLPAALSIFHRQGKDGAYNIYKYEYYGVRQNWEKLEEVTRKNLAYPVTANWHYLAKSYQGTLLTDLMKNRHNREYDLIFIPENKEAYSVLPHVLYRMGNMAAAQNVSYNQLFSSCGYNPSLLKMQADIELMRGNYQVAEKYISLLEKSLYYRKWASARREFLYDDARVEADAGLGRGRRTFPTVQNFTTPLYPMHSLFAILRSDPFDTAAIEYGLAYLLLAKDIVNVAKFIEEFYGTPGLRELPVCAQEAMCFFADYQQNMAHEEEFRHMDMDWCLSHGVQPQTVSRLYQMQGATLQAGGKAPKGFKDTYWHYFLYDSMIADDHVAQTDDKNEVY